MDIFTEGPLKINSMPLRRIAQAFVIATKTSLDITGLQIPEHINDDYFRRINRKKEAKKGDTNIFAQGTEVLIHRLIFPCIFGLSYLFFCIKDFRNIKCQKFGRLIKNKLINKY